MVDYPPEECEDFAARLKAVGLDLIFLLAPTSTDERMQQVGRIASGYVYYVSLKGVTGAGHLDTAAVAQMLPRIRAHVQVPVGVGFGIRDAATARAVGAVADAVVIGTRLIQMCIRDSCWRTDCAQAAGLRRRPRPVRPGVSIAVLREFVPRCPWTTAHNWPGNKAFTR